METFFFQIGRTISIVSKIDIERIEIYTQLSAVALSLIYVIFSLNVSCESVLHKSNGVI